MKLDLKDVTICAVDSVNPALAARAVRLSMAQCEFADAILFSHAPAEGPFRSVKIDKVDSALSYANFVFKRLPSLIDTPFLLIVQWDGYVINAPAWHPSFREFDFIGARWPSITDGMSVGNGGFSLRSRRFMSALQQGRFPMSETVPSDMLACRTYRPALERDYGIRFAPEVVADKFSYETTQFSEFDRPWPPTFGFHGMGNLWRHAGDADLVDMTDNLAPYTCRTPHYAQLMMSCFLLGRHRPLAALYRKMKAHVDSNTRAALIRRAAGGDNRTRRFLSICERLTGGRDFSRWAAVASVKVRRHFYREPDGRQ
jgi:Protein of unknown function (DUF5672)